MLTDTHCHLNLPEFKPDLDQVIQTARETGLKKILVPGIDLESSIQAVKLADSYPGFIYAAVGIHPNYSTKDDHKYLNGLRELLENPSVVAIGEIGLDYYRDFSEKDIQKKTFEFMLDLAAEFEKPVCIHQRDSAEDVLEILDRWKQGLLISGSKLAKNPGVFHSFGGEDHIFSWAGKNDFYFGISGFITYKKSDALRSMLGKIQKSRLLIETDAPYITPEPYRGHRNEPSNVRFTAQKITEVLQLSFETVSDITEENSTTLFGW